jgi:hypothetical protein
VKGRDKIGVWDERVDPINGEAQSYPKAVGFFCLGVPHNRSEAFQDSATLPRVSP